MQGYLTLKVRNSCTSVIKKKELLPKEAKNFIKVIEDILNIPVVYLSNGPDRKDIIKLRKFY